MIKDNHFGRRRRLGARLTRVKVTVCEVINFHIFLVHLLLLTSNDMGQIFAEDDAAIVGINGVGGGGVVKIALCPNGRLVEFFSLYFDGRIHGEPVCPCCLQPL